MDNKSNSSHPFGSVPIEVTISVGKARPTIKELLDLKNDTVLVLDRQIDDPVELFVGNKLVGRAQLEEITQGANTGSLAVRITELFDQGQAAS
mgnify:CR=1 FL=1